MTVTERLANARRAFLDTAPVIYFVEGNPRYLPAVEGVFQRLDAQSLTAVITSVTLAECLVHPLRNNDQSLVSAFYAVLSRGPGTMFYPLDAVCGRRAAEMRAAQNFSLTDALQLAAASVSGCDVFLTNDVALKKAASPQVILIDELLSEMSTP